MKAIEQMALPHRLSNNVSISLQDSWTILGVKGSGKTTFARNWLPVMWELYPAVRTYILDSKGYGEFDDIAVIPGNLLFTQQESPPPNPNAGQVQVWRPPLNDMGAYNDWFGMILRDQKPCLVIVDEVASLAQRKSVVFPDNFILLLKQGRLMEEVPVVMSQELAYMDRNIFGQMTHFLRFYLINQYDIRASNKLMGFPQKDLMRNPSHEHGFFYRRMDKPTWPTYEYSGWQEFLRGGS